MVGEANEGVQEQGLKQTLATRMPIPIQPKSHQEITNEQR
uniref:Uncharacterized protein n=1 Tax=Romanomermis culicivorax TaxID=13658 RepID=A0A915JYF8_ROMCU